MDAIEKFCFTPTEEPPERKVLDALLEFVIVKKLDGEKSGTKELSPFNEHGIDFSPVVRSFLLQFCLQEHVETRLGCFYVTAILSCGRVEVKVEVELRLRLRLS